MINFSIIALLGFLVSTEALASPQLQVFETKKPICIQNGPKTIKSLGVAYARENTLKRNFRDGQVSIPAGCRVEVETTRELLGTESESQLAQLQYINIATCEKEHPMSAGGAQFFALMFDTKGCLEGAFNSKELRVCNEVFLEGQRLNFKDGLLDCSGGTEKVSD